MLMCQYLDSLALKAWFPLVAEPHKNAKFSHCGHAGFCSRLTACMQGLPLWPCWVLFPAHSTHAKLQNVANLRWLLREDCRCFLCWRLFTFYENEGSVLMRKRKAKLSCDLCPSIPYEIFYLYNVFLLCHKGMGNQGRRSNSRARGANRNERAQKTTFSKYLLSSFLIMYCLYF